MAVENINDIVSQEAIEQLFNLGRQLESVKDKMSILMGEADKLKTSLNQASTLRETAEGVKDLNNATEKINKTNNERLNIEREIKQRGADMAKVIMDETNHLENLNKVMDEYAESGIDLSKYINNSKKSIEFLRFEIKQLTREYKNGITTKNEYIESKIKAQREIESYNQQLREHRKELNTVEQSYKATDKSFNGLQARLVHLKNVWKELHEDERENAEIGGVLLTEINNIDEAVKGLAASIGENQRNVGNYETAYTSLIGKLPMGNSLFARMAITAQKTGQSLGTVMVGGLKAVGKAMTSLLFHPLILAIAGIVAFIMAIVNAIKQNEEQLNRLTKAFAPLQAILNIVFKILSFVADKLVDIIGDLAKVTSGVMKWAEKLPLVGKHMKDVNDEMNKSVVLEERRQILAKKTREDMVKIADIELDVAKLRDKVAQSDKYTKKERIAFLQEAIKKEQEILRIKQQQLVEEHNILVAEINARGGLNKASKEQLDSYFSLKAAIKDSKKEFFTSTRRMQIEMSTLIKSQANQRKVDSKDEEKRDKKVADKKEEYLKELYQLERSNATKTELLKMDIAEAERKRAKDLLDFPELEAEINDKYNLEIKNLKEKSAKEQVNIQLKLQDDILTSVEVLNEQRIKLGVASEQEMTDKLIEIYEQRQKYLLEKLEAEKIEELRQYENGSVEYLKVVDLYANRELEIVNNTEISKREIRKKGFDATIKELKEQLIYEQNLTIVQQDGALSEKQIRDAKIAGLKEELELWNLKKDSLDELGIAEQEYAQKSAEIQAQLVLEEQKAKEQRQKDIVDMGSSLLALGDVMADQVEDEKERTKIKQGLAMAQVLLNEGIALSEAAVLAFQGDAYTAIPRLIASIAAIAAGIIPAISAINKAKAYKEGTNFHVGGAAIIGEGGESELVETPTGQRFIVNKPSYFENLPIGTNVTPFSRFERSNNTDMTETNELLKRINSKPTATIDVSDKITTFLTTKIGRNKILNSKFKF